MQRAPAAAAAAAIGASRSSSASGRTFSVSIPSLPLPPKPPASKWLPIENPPSTGTNPILPRWLERPNGAPLPFLSNSLEKVVLAGTKPQLIEKMTTEKGESYPDSFRRISQPEDINWKGVHGFTASSRDDMLHALAQQEGCNLKGSTSSVSGVLSHIYFALSNFKRVRTKLLSSHFKDQPDNFTLATKLPCVVVLRPRDGIYSCDAYDSPSKLNAAGKRPHQILMDLGKSMERLLTLDERTFTRLLLHRKVIDETIDPWAESAYNYMVTQHGAILRSQLDCAIKGTNRIFDLKTRATNAIRLNVEQYKDHLDYKITRIIGSFNSFEREFYDMMRSCFLKYSFQLRIGKMDGAFVTYHNTQEIFGFQYIPLSVIDNCIYGSSAMGLHFLDICLASMSQIFGHVTKAFDDPTSPIMLRVCAQPGVGTVHPPALYICAWKVIDTDLTATTQEDIDGGVTYETRKTGEGRAFVVTFKHTLNGVEEPSLCNDFKPDADSPRSFICVTEMTEKGMCSKFDAAFDSFVSISDNLRDSKRYRDSSNSSKSDQKDGAGTKSGDGKGDHRRRNGRERDVEFMSLPPPNHQQQQTGTRVAAGSLAASHRKVR